MIPKMIHYCWLSGDPFPATIQKCVDSWETTLPDYQLMLWDTNRFDVNSCKWVRQAYENKKYAFAADYLRLYALYHYGGIYLDSDVEVLKSFDDLLDLPYFIGVDSRSKIEAAIIGTEPHNKWIGYCLEYYKDRDFVSPDGKFDMKTLPIIMEERILTNRRMVHIDSASSFDIHQDMSVYFFPFNYFCSKRHDTGQIQVTRDTYSIHHFAMSWRPGSRIMLTKIKRLFVRLFGERFYLFVKGLFRLEKLEKLCE